MFWLPYNKVRLLSAASNKLESRLCLQRFRILLNRCSQALCLCRLVLWTANEAGLLWFCRRRELYTYTCVLCLVCSNSPPFSGYEVGVISKESRRKIMGFAL
ncbi:hypothetical protein ACOSP7_008117 [Xanthoceras sorbifolium]